MSDPNANSGRSSLDTWQVQSALNDLAKLSVNFDGNIRSIVIDLAAVRAEVKVVSDQVQRQARLLTDGGNGQPSVLNSLAVLEERLSRLIRDYEEQEERTEHRSSEISQMRGEIGEIKASFAKLQESLTQGKNGVIVKTGIDWGDNKTRVILSIITVIGAILTPIAVSYFTARDTVKEELNNPPALQSPSPRPPSSPSSAEPSKETRSSFNLPTLPTLPDLPKLTEMFK